MTSSKDLSSSFSKKLSRAMPAELTAIHGGTAKSLHTDDSMAVTLSREDTSTAYA